VSTSWTDGRRGTLGVTGKPEVDDIVNANPFALLVAMLFDQQIPISWAFAGPARLAERLERDHGASLAAASVAALSPDDVVALAAEKPALHRFPSSMGVRLRELAAAVVEDHDGDPERIWGDGAAASTVVERLTALPGYGDEKARILVAVLAKRFGVEPKGWRDVCGGFADEGLHSVADVDSPDALAALKARRAELKRQGKDKTGAPK